MTLIETREPIDGEAVVTPDRPPYIVVVGNTHTIESKLAEAFVRGYTPKLMAATGDDCVRLTHVLCEHADVRAGSF